ncbi:MAG: UDP-N-acetylmuramoyl-L-alanyl-D-glutamate--2,6-diaminopimelate ligase [Gammaproteobacteria bacterium]|nr:MAG: UDP-N-acetylmuramoyl-L-alanyl-D-glutamate--2,6-diaminopimelate ligase [Gammaproteobacteria bacterium]
MKLKTLLHAIGETSSLETSLPKHLGEIEVSALVNDTRHIQSGCVFLAEKGLTSHALDYLSEENCRKTAAVVYQPDYDIHRFGDAVDRFIAVNNLNCFINLLSQRFFAPVFAKPLIGITGTNGKTSISQFIAQLADYGVIGTMGYGRLNALTPLSHTTPDALSVSAILKELSLQVAGVAMEVSSHALALHRVDALDFKIAVFTNLTQDHLDFHDSMDDYFASKAKLFDYSSVETVVINVDDVYGRQLAQRCQNKAKRVLAFGQKNAVCHFDEYVQIQSVQLSSEGLQISLFVHIAERPSHYAVFAPIWGEFNAYNIVAALLALYAAGESLPVLLMKVAELRGVLGRMDPIALGNHRTAIIDYAHTPGALASTLKGLRQQVKGQIYTVFGCGGDRDRTKRPLMAQAANQFSDFVIVTDDNPRTEQSEVIIADILAADVDLNRFKTIASRRQAIRFGLSLLAQDDVLLIAGKGHEDYQIIGSEKTHFSDYEVVQEWLHESV